MPRGGARPGAGRPPKALRYADTARLVEEKIVAALPDLTDTLIEAAKKGDFGAARYLIDRILGRVATVEVAPVEDRRFPPMKIDFERDAELQTCLSRLAG